MGIRARLARVKSSDRPSKKPAFKASRGASPARSDVEVVEERLEFERLLADLAARFANVPADDVVAEIERALGKLVDFFGYDRCTFAELGLDGRLQVLAAASSHRVAPMARGSFVQRLVWLTGEIRAGRIVALNALPDDLPDEAVAEAEYCREVGLRSHLSIPLRAGARIMGVLAFAGMRPAPAWPEALITRLSIIGEVFAGSLARAHAEEELQRLRSRLWHADRVARTGALAAAIAHELNQPLAAILSNAQAALNYLDTDESPHGDLRAALEAVVRDDKRAADTIRSLRAFLRRGETEVAPLDLAATLRDVLQMLDPELRRHGIRVQAALGTSRWVMADRVQMEQVALNLLLNAITAMQSTPREERTLSVSIAADAPGTPATVSVADSGKGIEAADLDKVFEPFWTTSPDGLGLGLAICRSIVEAHGGEIEVEPNAGKGAKFRFSLPAAHVAAGAEGVRPDIGAAGPTPSAAAGDARAVVALVDDDPAVREGIARLVSSKGWTVRAFKSAEAFLEEREGLHIGCLLLDIRMEGRSGLRLYERLRAEGDAPPAVFLSGHGDVATSVEAMKLGAVEFLEKPVAKEQLFAAVDKALSRHAEQCAQARQRDAARSRIARLSPREQDVMVRVVRGRLNKQIAAELGISEQTVKQHRGRVMQKLEADSVADLVRLCETSGVCDRP